MSEDANTKAKRRRRIRESFAPPHIEIAIRQVDSVKALTEKQREILAKVLEKTGVRYLAASLAAIKEHGANIEDEDDLMALLKLADKPQRHTNVLSSKSQKNCPKDAVYLAKLLVQCFPDMPQTSADALAASDVMSASLDVVSVTRHALENAKSDFVIIALHELFTDRLDAIVEIINSNPAFVKALKRSHPEWHTKN
jgi:predicted metal-binding protein